KALNLVNAMRELFWDETEGGFFFYGQDAESLIARPKDLYDGALPSGNSVAAWVLARLFRMTGDAGLETLVRRMFSFFTPEVMRHPRSYAGFLLAGELYGSSPRQVVLANQGNREEIAGFLQEIGRRFLPDAAILYHDPTRQGAVEKYLPHIQAQGPVEGRAAAYVCENFACQKPVTDPAALAGLLERKVLWSPGR
ncbi:MAG: hypothetical protein AAGU32_21440, partial [Bacillota bacterium]